MDDIKKSILTIFMLFIVIFIIAGLADADVDNNTNDNTKFSIKSKFLGLDKNFNTEMVRINIILLIDWENLHI